MNHWVGFGVLAMSLAYSALAQNAPQSASPTLPGTAPAAAAPPPAPARGATINAATGQVVPGTVAPEVLRAQAQAGAVTNRAALLATNVNPALSRSIAGAAAAAPSKITPVQMQNINRLDVELNRLAIANRDPADQQRALVELLQAAPVGNTRPAPASIARLGASLAGVTRTLNLTAAQRRQLAIDLNLALNSANLSPTEAQRVLADARTLLQGSAVANPQGTEQLLAGLEGIVNQLQGTTGQAAASQPAPGTVSNPGVTPAPQPAFPAAQGGQNAAGQTGQGSGAGTVPPVSP
jgi:hypothetical protein